MTEQAVEEVEREEIEMLLPWYATGKLDRADMAKVESYLARHPQLSGQLDLIRTEQEQTVVANEGLGSPSVGAVDRLMDVLPAAKPGLAQRITGSGLFRSVADFFAAPAAREVRWAAVAATALVAIQAAAITGLLIRDRGGTYQTASGQQQGDGVSALIVFTDEATAPAIAKLLAEFHASIVDGPKPGGVYKIRLRTEDRSQSAQEALLRRMAERRDVVRAVVPSRD